MAATVKGIFGHDTNGSSGAEASLVGSAALINTAVAAPTATQNATLILPQAAGLTSTWDSRAYTVAGDDFIVGFWVLLLNPDMGGVGLSQDIFLFSSDGGITLDWRIRHAGNFPSADQHFWYLIDANNVIKATATDPIVKDTWTWVGVRHVRSDAAGEVSVYFWTPGRTLKMTASNQDFKASAGTSALVFLLGHNAAPAAGGLAVRYGGGYIMDGSSAVADILSPQQFLSLRTDKNSATPDTNFDGSGAGDNLTIGTWDLTGDENVATVGNYAAGKNGAVKTVEYDLHSKVLDGDHNIGKFIFDANKGVARGADAIWGFSDTGGYTVTSGAFGPGAGLKTMEKLVFFGDTYFPRFGILAESPRATPVLGFAHSGAAGSHNLREASYLTMWPVDSPGEAVDISKLDHWTRGVGRGVCRGVTR